MTIASLIVEPLCIGIELKKCDSMMEVGLPAAISCSRISQTMPDSTWPQVWIALPQDEQPEGE